MMNTLKTQNDAQKEHKFTTNKYYRFRHINKHPMNQKEKQKLKHNYHKHKHYYYDQIRKQKEKAEKA